MSRYARRLTFFLLAFYLIATTGYLLHRSFSQTKSSISLLQAGENTLLNDPASATKDFQLSEQAANQSLGTIREARWWNRLISLLPPLRWQVQLAKASYYLAEAGQSTIALQRSLNVIDAKPVNGDPLVATGNHYLTWYAAEAPTVAALQTQLDMAKANFDPIPDWIFLSQSDNFIRLQAQLAQLTSAIAEDRRIGDGILSLTSPNQTASLVLLPVNSSDSGSLGTLRFQGGRIQELSFQPLSPSLLAAYVRGEQRNAFWSATARDVARRTGADNPPGAVAVIDPQLLRDLLKISGPLQITGVANPTVTAGTLGAEAVSPGDLLDRLLAASLQPARKPLAIAALRNAIATQNLQLWSSDLRLSPLTNELADSLPPAGHGNWLRIIPESAGGLSVSITQTHRQLQQDTLQTVTVTGSSEAPHIALPSDVRITQGDSTVRSGYLEGSMKRAGDAYAVTYALPRTTDMAGSIRYLVPLAGSQKVTAFGHEKLITEDSVLTP